MRLVTVLHGTEEAPFEVEVEGWTAGVPGLAVTRYDPNPSLYVVSHLSSGRTVGPYVWKSRAAAIRAMRGLAAITDWDAFEFTSKDKFPDDLKAACRAVCLQEGKHYWNALWEW